MGLPRSSNDRNRKSLTSTMIGIVAQVGVITLMVILAALFLGMWLDNQFHSKPWIVLILMIASIPASLWMMFRVVRLGTEKIKASLEPEKTNQKEDGLGKDT